MDSMNKHNFECPCLVCRSCKKLYSFILTWWTKIWSKTCENVAFEVSALMSQTLQHLEEASRCHG